MFKAVFSESPNLAARLEAIVAVKMAGAMPEGGAQGQILVKSSGTDYDAAWKAPATKAEADNTLPITSAAVHTEIGNIETLLAAL